MCGSIHGWQGGHRVGDLYDFRVGWWSGGWTGGMARGRGGWLGTIKIYGMIHWLA